jgi:hypothetical protein
MFTHHLALSDVMWARLIFTGKISGAVCSISGLLWVPVKRSRAFFKQISGTSTNVDKLLSNHLPHLKTLIEETKDQNAAVRSEVAVLSSRMSGIEAGIGETKTAITVLNASFLNHLENAVAEAAPKRKRK